VRLREAALLTRHLGLVEELPGIVERAAAASTAFDAWWLASQGYSFKRRGRSTWFIGEWSHARSVKFLEDAPP